MTRRARNAERKAYRQQLLDLRARKLNSARISEELGRFHFEHNNIPGAMYFEGQYRRSIHEAELVSLR